MDPPFPARHRPPLPERSSSDPHLLAGAAAAQQALSFPLPESLPQQSKDNDESNATHNGIGRRLSRSDAPGVALSWKDLWVTVPSPSPNGKSRALLHGLTGFAEPGQIMAIMGPSGSGKSTLLDTLAGRLSHNTKQTGEILVNGRRQSLSYGNSAYVTQDDVLMATLTVREAVFYSAQLQLPSSMSIEEKRERAESTIKDMGLQGAANTQIGGWRARGLSGGEKRRVSIAIELLTKPPLLFLDEPTSGLDSAAAFHVINRLRHLALGGRTIIASIHQPSSDVFELFHFLCLLSGGKTIYFGAAAEAREFFSSNGFPCPPLRNPSDHYLRTINEDFERDIEEGAPGVKLRTKQVIDTLVKAYAASDTALEVTNRVNDLSKLQGPPLQSSSNRANFFTQVRVLTIRSFKNMYRDLGYYWLRLAIYVALCICVGTIFYKVGTSYSAIQARGAMLMFVAAFLTFMAIGGFPAFVEDMKVFDRERLNGHYGVASFVIANTLSSSPYLFLISALPGAIAYFLVDLHHGFDHFAYFVLTLYTCMLVVESLMMMVASIVPDFLLGIITGAGIQGVFMLNGGFFRLPDDIPKPFWRYPMSYMAFHTYANQAHPAIMNDEMQEKKLLLKQVKPPEFDGKGKEVESAAETWMESMEDYFIATGTALANQAMIAKLKLTGEARLWWKQWCKDQEISEMSITWERLKEAVCGRYLPPAYHTLKMNEFFNLRQLGMSLEAYYSKFITLLKYAPTMDISQQVSKFCHGLDPPLNTSLEAMHPTDLQDALIRAKPIVKELQSESKGYDKVSDDSRDQDKRCHQCGELGHIQKICPDRQCFYCKEFGHIQADCLELSQEDGNPSKKRSRVNSAFGLYLEPEDEEG